jgi:hypothetical protein
MAVAAIGNVTVNGTLHTLKLKQIDTNEVHGPPGDGYAAMKAAIQSVDLIVGGFRTEAVYSYREVAMESKVIFMNCGAATEALQHDVANDYLNYQYWFKATPYNETFLVTSLLKMLGTAGKGLRDGLAAAEASNASLVNADYEIGTGPNYTLRVAIIAESLSWAHGIVATASQKLPTLQLASQNITYQVVRIERPLSTATSLVTELTNIANAKPHIIFTAFSGPVGVAFSTQRLSYVPWAMVLGINVEGQSKNQWVNTGGNCTYDMMLDTWAEGVNVTSKTNTFFTGFLSAHSDYPTYCAATYDAIYALAACMDATDSLNTSVMIPYLETHSTVGAGAKNTTYYPMPGIDLGSELYALNESQVLVLYPHLQVLKTLGMWAYNQTEWLVGPHTAHDTVYGSEYQTGLGVIWSAAGNGTKVGWWPVYLPSYPNGLSTLLYVLQVVYGMNATANATAIALWNGGLLDNYGYWNWAYSGEVSIVPFIGAMVARFFF